MKDIDYDAYLKTIPDLATSQKDIIKKYLEEQCEKDEALKALYKPSHIDGCYNFILECVRKTATGGCNAVVEDAVVFKMARDYFLEILPTIAEEPPEIKTEAMPEDKAKGGTEAEDSEEDVVQVESCAMPEDVARDMSEDAAKEAEEIVIPEQVQYDENGNGMLFEF